MSLPVPIRNVPQPNARIAPQASISPAVNWGCLMQCGGAAYACYQAYQNCGTNIACWTLNCGGPAGRCIYNCLL